MPKTIYITTPSYNCVATIDRTIQSVVTQAGDFFIRYHVQDAGSDDGTLDRLAWWQRQLASKGFAKHCRGIEFSFASAPDDGMYDGLCKGFAAMRIPMDGFMSWINGDDFFVQGAFAFIDAVAMQFTQQQVSWVGGATTIFRENMPLAQFDNPIVRDAMCAEICEGKHWNFLQQEGAFFRNWLWRSIKPEDTIAPMRLAGDWNMGRLFAAKASLVQTKMALASFRITQGQLSASQRESYQAEIDALISEADRRAGSEALALPDANLVRWTFKINYGSGQLTVVEEGRNGMMQHNPTELFEEDAKRFKPASDTDQDVIVYTGVMPEPAVALEDGISFENGILAFDRDWQFPAITEQQAFHQIRDTGSVPEGVTYVAYPWAHLIDKIQTKSSDANVHLAQFQAFCDRIPMDTTLVTVCQHIKMKEFLDLFEQAGIAHVFWSHATHEDVAMNGAGGLDIRPFPLFPVQIPEVGEQIDIAARPYLFSFVGAKSNQYYLTDARSHILDLLRDHPKGLIIGRDDWHYNKVVYEHQIRPGGRNGNADDLVNKSNSEQFRMSLAQSVFSLCPSGSGPNSIRLWESLGAGAIPVVMADTYAPPGDPALWQAAAVFCEETSEAIAALPARLEKLAADPEQLRGMQRAAAQIWLLYGPQSFVYDVQKRMLELGQGPQSGEPELAPAHGGPDVDQRSGTALRDLLVARLRLQPQLSQRDALGLLRICASNALIEGAALLPRLRDDATPLGQMLTLAQEILPDSHPTLSHYRAVMAHVASAPALTDLSAPAVAKGQGPKICFLGRHANRTPLSYPAFQATAQGRITVVDDPVGADVIMTGFNLDLQENAERFEQIAKDSPDTRIMVISEEPLWDANWSGGFSDTARVAKCGDAQLPYTFLNHSNSNIYTFDRIPYFLLTSDDLLTRYSTLIARNLKLTPQDLLSRWRTAAIPAAFVAEKREGDKYALAFPEQEVWGLSSYRSEVAAKTDLPGVYIEGKGWHSEARRQDLPDWHLDKLTKLDGRVRVLSSYENTHQQHYISEKIFDAFIVGGVPTYYASPTHAIHRLVPGSCIINSFGLTSDQAAAQIRDFDPDLATAEAWLDTARQLRARFADTQAICAERLRIVDVILTAVSGL
ncbi:hypothetical protein AL036_19285 [Salipiger aestuarii]|uniref:exostosin domain-containing protein n=1 Tax=Salipiger aestuarii TaxID=568098 RepID=UPI001239B9E4|nr:exostosin family protein [Salipiger aestuarii]KAA8605398.1 hypothetical protein AL036_19285 [Salipiger aestuarii]